MTSETTTSPTGVEAADATRATAPEPTDPPVDDQTQPRSTADIANAGSADIPARQPSSTDTQAPIASTPPTATEAPLFDESSAGGYRERWLAIQTEFVDEPRGAVQKADTLVAEVMTQLAETFAQERKAMEQRLAAGQDTSTEDLRQAIRRYRSFFNRLLAV